MFDIENTALILIDVQGKLASLMHDRENLYKNFEIIIKSMNILNVPVIWMEQVPDKLGPTIENIAENLSNIKPVAKYTFSCFGNEEFQNRLEMLARKNILLTGIETHICVYQTACDLIDQGYNVQVIQECVSSREEKNKTLGLNRIEKAGGLITGTEMILFELMKSTKADGFREITKLIK